MNFQGQRRVRKLIPDNMWILFLFFAFCLASAPGLCQPPKGEGDFSSLVSSVEELNTAAWLEHYELDILEPGSNAFARLQYPDGTEKYYDEQGRNVAVRDQSGVKEFYYDAMDRPTAILTKHDGKDYLITFDYDSWDNIKGIGFLDRGAGRVDKDWIRIFNRYDTGVDQRFKLDQMRQRIQTQNYEIQRKIQEMRYQLERQKERHYARLKGRYRFLAQHPQLTAAEMDMIAESFGYFGITDVDYGRDVLNAKRAWAVSHGSVTIQIARNYTIPLSAVSSGAGWIDWGASMADSSIIEVGKEIPGFQPVAAELEKTHLHQEKVALFTFVGRLGFDLGRIAYQSRNIVTQQKTVGQIQKYKVTTGVDLLAGRQAYSQTGIRMRPFRHTQYVPQVRLMPGEIRIASSITPWSLADQIFQINPGRSMTRIDTLSRIVSTTIEQGRVRHNLDVFFYHAAPLLAEYSFKEIVKNEFKKRMDPTKLTHDFSKTSGNAHKFREQEIAQNHIRPRQRREESEGMSESHSFGDDGPGGCPPDCGGGSPGGGQGDFGSGRWRTSTPLKDTPKVNQTKLQYDRDRFQSNYISRPSFPEHLEVSPHPFACHKNISPSALFFTEHS